MGRLKRSVIACAVLFWWAIPASGGWWEVQRLDAALQLQEARQQALRSFFANPRGPEAVALAGWWFSNLDNLKDPGEIVENAPRTDDPAVAFLLGLIEAELAGSPPPGTLSSFEISGPWGISGVLDVARDHIPAEDELPEVATPWSGPGSHFNYRCASEFGHLRTPSSLTADGLTVAAVSVRTDSAVDGWMVLEGRGSLYLELDGRVVDRIHLAGIDAPGVVWYRLNANAGTHRIRLALAPPATATARLTFLQRDGAPIRLHVLDGPVDADWTASTVVRRMPESLSITPHEFADVPEALLAAELARLRADPAAQLQAIENALSRHGSEPMVHLAAATYFLFEHTAAAAEVIQRRTREHLQRCAELPIFPIVERHLALRQGRQEDVDRLRDVLWNLADDDPRILRARLNIAASEGWQLETQAVLTELAHALGQGEALVVLRAESAAAMGHTSNLQDALRRLVSIAPPRSEQIGELLDACLSGEALKVARQLQNRIDDPDLDADVIRLLITQERLEEARDALAAARTRWGPLPPLDDLALALVGEDEEDLSHTLTGALATRPGDLILRSLTWQLGEAEPFWEPFSVDVHDVTESSDTSEEGVDAVLLLDQAVERVFRDGSSLYYYHGLSKALTPAGARQVATLEQMGDNDRLTLRIVKPDGTVVIPTEISGNNGEVVISDVEPGDLVEESYVAAVRPFSSAIRGHLSPYVYRFADSDRNFGLSEYVLVIDKDIDVTVDGFFEGIEFSETVGDSLRTMHWRAKDVPAVPNEPFAPPAQELLPWVTYGFGIDWPDIGDRLRDRLLISLRTSPELDAFTRQRLTGDDPKDALGRLVNDLLERVEGGPSLLDVGSTAEGAFARGRGNRLGVLAGALVAAGWKTDLILSRPAALAGSHLNVPSRELFISPLLRVHRAGQEIWIDLHDDALGVDSVSPILQGSDGLVLPLSNPAEVVSIEPRLPTFDNPQLLERSTLRVEVEPDGAALIDLTTWLQENEASRLVKSLASVPEDRIPGVFSRIANSIFPGATEVVGTILEQENDVGLHLELRLPSSCERQGDELVCRGLSLNQPLAPLLASLSERNHPLVLQLPIQRRFEVIVRLPEGWSMERAPRRLDSRWGSVHEEMTQSGPEVRSVLELRLPAGVVAPEDYAEFSRFCRAVDELVGRPIALQRSR